MELDLREHFRILARAVRIRIDFEGGESDPLLLKDQDDVGGGAGHHGEEGALHGTRTPPGLAIAGIESDFRGFVGDRSEAQAFFVDQVTLHATSPTLAVRLDR